MSADNELALDAELNARLARVQRVALGVGLLGAAVFAVGMLDTGGYLFGTLGRAQFFRSYLVGYLFVLAAPLGSMAIMMVHHLTGGRWGAAIRGLCEASMRTMPLIALLFLPIALGVHVLYPWADAGFVEHHPLVAAKSAYLNVDFFYIRAAVYFALWLALCWLMSPRAAVGDAAAQRRITRRLRRIAGPGLVLYVVTVSFAAIDWGMSLEPEWFSSVYGALYLVGQVLTALALMIVALILLAAYRPLRDLIVPSDFNDLGNLLLAFVMLWAYLSFSQFLLIWMANLPEETPYYLSRAYGPWQGVAIGLIACHFVLPFFLLMSRQNKRNRSTLLAIAVGLLAMRLIDIYWLIVPAFSPDRLSLSVLDLLAPASLGGLWLAAFMRQLCRRPLAPGLELRRKEPHHDA